MLTWEEFLRKKSLFWSSLLSPDDSQSLKVFVIPG